MIDLTGKVAVVTGGSRGIGEGICLRLANQGADVAILDILEKEGNETVSRIKEMKAKAAFYKCDITNKEQVDSSIGTILKDFGKIDILVNNAGVFFIRMFDQTTEEEWDKTFDVNVKGSYFLTQKVLPYFLKQGKGKIIFTGSIFGPIGAPAASSYAASKMAVHGLIHSLAIELAPKKINVNAVAPGNVDTPMNYELYEKFGGREAFRQQYPLGRIGLPEDIAAAVAFLASEEADWITGVVLPVDGGYLAK